MSYNHFKAVLKAFFQSFLSDFTKILLINFIIRCISNIFVIPSQQTLFQYFFNQYTFLIFCVPSNQLFIFRSRLCFDQTNQLVIILFSIICLNYQAQARNRMKKDTIHGFLLTFSVLLINFLVFYSIFEEKSKNIVLSTYLEGLTCNFNQD